MITTQPAPSQAAQGCWWDCAGANGTPPCIQRCWEDGFYMARKRRRRLGEHTASATVPSLVAIGAILAGVLTYYGFRR